MNPILAREIRVRFRDKRSFWLLFGLSALLCLLVWLIYRILAGRAEYTDAYYFTHSYTAPNLSQSDIPAVRLANATGRTIFELLTVGNVVMWLLIAPALTATGLTKERERGLLESLWLSPFKVWNQIAGRMGATLCFLFLLQLTTLPAYSIAFLLGGVSQQEIVLAGTIIGMTALLGATLGIWLSARSYRGASAMGGAFFILGVWSVACWCMAVAMSSTSSLAPPYLAVLFSHPLALMALLLEPGIFTTGVVTVGSNDEFFTLGLALQLALIVFMLWSATRKAAKPLPLMQWSEGNTRLKQRRQELEALRAEKERRREEELTSEKVAGALLYELPVERFVRFKDPLLSKEVRGRFRLRQGSKLVGAARFAIFLALIFFWLYVLFQATDNVTRADTGRLLLNSILGFGLLAVGVMASTSLIKEKENGTWEGLQLSLLNPTAVVVSKWLSPLITFTYWSAPLWILLPLFSRRGGPGVPLASLGTGAFIVICGLGVVSAWGLWISSRAPHSAAGTSWTLATIFFILGGLPVLDSMFGIRSYIVDWMYGPGTYDAFLYPTATSYNVFTHQSETIARPEMVASVRHLMTVLNTYNPFLSIDSLFQPSQADLWTPLILGVMFSIFVTALLLGLTLKRVKMVERKERN